MRGRILGLLLAVSMTTLGVLWTLQGLGWLGDAAPSQALATVGPLLAGFGVAFAYVVLQRRR